MTDRRSVVFLVHVEVGGWGEGVGDGFAGDEACAAAEGEVLETPFDENLNAALELNEIHEMDEEPDEPGEKTGDVQPEDTGDGSGATNDGHISLVEIAEGRNVLFSFQAGFDRFCGITSALNGDWRNARERLAVLVEGKREVADDENIGIVGNGEIRKHFDATATIGLGVSTLGNFTAEVVDGDATGPENGARGELDVRAVVRVVNAVGIDIVDHGVFEDFNAEMGNKLFGFGGKILRIGGKHASGAIEKDNAGFARIDVAKIMAKSFASNFGEGAGKFEASGASTDDDEGEPGAGFGFRAGTLGTFEGVENFVADGSGFLNSFETGGEGAPSIVAVIGSLRTGGDDEGVVGEGAAVAKNNFLGRGIEIDGFAEEDFGVFLAAEDRAERRGDLTGRERAGGNLIEKRLEEMEIALVDEGDGCGGVLEGPGGDESAKTATENENFVCTGHSESTVLVKWDGRDSLQESDLGFKV